MRTRPILIAPSILAADFARLGEEVETLADAGADWVHCDIMDGHFVDNISFGPAFVETISRHTDLPLDVHLMISHPDRYVERFAKFANSISVHVEANHDVRQTLDEIRASGCRPGLVLSPATPIERIEPFLSLFDMLLVMTVVPGFGGQSFILEMLEKVGTAAAWRDKLGLDFDIEVDGGVNPATARLSIASGANVMVAGTSVFRAADRSAEILSLRGS